MSPSRGLLRLLPTRLLPSTFSTLSTSSNPLQIYISTSHSPFLNLSIEHHLFTSTPAHTTFLLLYANTPSIVIGRNQNPWVEVNLPLLHRTDGPTINLVRRRSGGGTVFHDLGNVNYCVCTPSSAFDRDKHAEMVVRALHGLGAKRAVVNKRHDIVLLPDGEAEGTKMHGETPEGTRKISGSAYKLTRLRSYHHGTMLLDSRLEDVRSYLRSPAKGWLKARGVDSVRSPVANVSVGQELFLAAVVREFVDMYLGTEKGAVVKKEGEEQKVGVCFVGEEALEVEKIRKGVEELKSPEWIYGQTPQLTFSVPPPPDSSPPFEGGLQPPKDAKLTITANKGIIESVSSENIPLEGLIGKKFDGGIITDHITAGGGDQLSSASATISNWVESVLGRTMWGKR